MRTRGFNDEASRLMAASVRPETSGRNYNYMVRIYMDWCSNLFPPVDPFTAPIAVVANFLAWVHSNRDVGQSAVASYRSAISKVHVGLDGVPLGKSVAISNLIKGVGNLNPDRKARKPRYADTWDLAPVLDALAALHPTETLSPMDLTVKSLALVALTTISRSSTLGILSRHFVVKENRAEGGRSQLFVKYLPGSREKTITNRTGLFIPALSEEASLDPALYLQAYKLSLRPEGEIQEDLAPLWVSTRKPHLPVKSVTLATWMRKAMEKGGVDTQKYKAHSIRAAVPAHLKGNKALSLSQILVRGGWKASSDGKSRTFLRFYDKSVQA